MVTLDSVNYTSSTEYSDRTRSITHLQVHHATTTSLGALRALMAPGGRTVSANGAMGNDGHLMGVVPENKRAFTSATSFDNNSYTIEVCNTTLAPHWGISDACHWRLARVAVDLHRQYGMPLDRAHIIGHNEVPGTYATACPGPSMDLNRVVAYARQLLSGTAGGGVTPISNQGEDMYPIRVDGRDVYYVSPGRIYYETYGAAAELIKNITTADDKYHEVSGTQFPQVLAGFGIPSNIPGILRTGKFGQEWSRDRDNYDRIERLLVDVAAIQKALDAK